MDLIKACESNDAEKALGLIMNNNTNLGIVDSHGRTALILASICNTTVALKLIKTGHSKPEQVDNFGYTALICACRNVMKEVALELIKTGKSNPEHIDKDGYTSLSWACENGMNEVAYELVLIGAFTINDLLFLKPEWVPEELFIMNPVNVTEVDI